MQVADNLRFAQARLFPDYVKIIFRPKTKAKDYIRIIKRLCLDYLCCEKVPLSLQHPKNKRNEVLQQKN